jgi:tetratricopeptide (TPR) repeat protein
MLFLRKSLLLGCALSLWAGTRRPTSAQVATHGPDSQATAHAVRGFDFARAGELDEAEARLRQAEKLSPSDPEVLAALGTVLAQENKLDESTELFRRALRIDSANLAVRRYLAANLWQLHRYPEAKENLQIILKRKPDDKAAQLLLGMVSENMGDYATAARMLAAAPDLVREQPESIAALARSYYHLHQTEKARATLAQLAAHPAGPPATLLGAQIADEMEDYPTAKKLLGSIPAALRDQPRIQYTMALVEYHTGHFDRCQGILETLIASGNRNAAILNLLGWCHQKQGQPQEALQSLEESVTLAPGEVANYLDLTKILLAQRSLPSALRAANRTVNMFPNSAAASELQGLVEVRMGQFTDAVRSYTRAVELDRSRPEPILELAQAQFAAGTSQDAAATFETGIKQFPRDARLKAQYGAALLKQSETGDVALEAKAEQLLRSALTLDPSLSDAHYQLGNLALSKGRTAEAQQQLEQTVKLDGQNAAAHFALSRVYRRLGRRPEAAHEMELYESLKQEPEKDTSMPAPAASPEQPHP